ncbi:MAG: tetraacyldisaccharide 4'-kinase [Rhodobacteraceae bacterium]|nr:tetraacyldisaccharide 4'-kinase [Paracoccaceae bacterium]
MRAPRFWLRPPDRPGLRARLLSPLGRIYAAATAKRLRSGALRKLDVPVVCVGNINAGGVGKTPTVIAVSQELQNRFHTPHIISRGYGGSAVGPVHVDPTKHSAAFVGDEPLLLAAFSEVWVAKDRVAGAQAALDAGATALVLDDGFQHAALSYDLSIVVVDAAQGFGNGRCLPAGPLREPIDVGLARADVLITIGDTDAQDQFTQRYPHLANIPRARAELVPLQTGMPWEGLRAFAFAGIGQPKKFFATLKKLGAEIVHAEALGDHAKLSPAFLRRLEQDAAAANAQLVTTEKDAARLPPSFRTRVITLPVRLQFSEDAALTEALNKLPKPD